MQTAPATFLAPPPQNGYQPLSEAEIYVVKRQYLGLLPLQQVKSSVWPYDIRAAIASIQAQKAQASQTQTCSESNAPLRDSPPDADISSGEKTTQSQPSSPQQRTLVSTQAGPPASTPSVSQPATTQSQPAPTAPGPRYPHQPYYHPTYPHAPYFASPHGAYGYPHPYPSYLQPTALYPVNSATHHPPPFANVPLVHPSYPASDQPPPDDLPSYEEMIVEALLDSGDPEGCAPKSLFSWMAMHYPLQMNFRPSASQALQKAYKRGRLEKGSNGKYRLNESWEGGNTSRRTTRRPQTLAQTTLPGPQPPSSPFTHAPLAPHGAANMQTRLPPPGQPPGYGGHPFGYPYHGMSGSAHVSASRDSSGLALQKRAADTTDYEAGEGSDAWEAAQNILKAINFGQLFQLSREEDKAGESSTSGNSPHQQATVDGPDKSPSVSSPIVAEESAGSRLDAVEKSAGGIAEQRAALQAQLALLAAQLADLADLGEDEISHNLEASQTVAIMPGACTPQMPGESGRGGDDSDNNDNEDMVEVLVPMASLTA